jgi:hypothetical protein
VTAANPVLPGFHPDPSICRVGDEFFVVTSTFEYFPGLPVHRSRDLVEWQLVGHAVHREDQLDLSTVAASGGLFAPTIRHHDGRFFVACTLVGGEGRQGSFVVTATDPAGPWSDPAWIEDAPGIDPSILFDDDGRAWWCGTRLADPGDWPEQTEVWVRELDLATMSLVGEEHVVWHGAVEGAVWAEGPHLYRRVGEVLLLASEGGTERHHAVSAARGPSPTGPFTGSRANPLLTHRHLGGDSPVANVGHADLVDDFDGPTLHPELTSVRTAPGVRRAQLGERPGHLRLHAASGSLQERAPHAFAGFRLEQPVATLATVVEAPDAPSPGLLAGLALRLSERRHLTFGVRAGTLGRIVELVIHVDGDDHVLGRADAAEGRLGLALEIDGFEAVARVEYGERRIAVGTADLSPLSPSEGGGFVGVVGGVFVVGEPARDEEDAALAASADFDLLSLVHAHHLLRGRRRRALPHDEARGEVHARRGGR